jgi:demethylmenaquinone methyltransferase/2-methoxy-6-polyprenyl-1,4-benzoquinol methylase
MGPGMETNKFHQPGEHRAARVEDLFAIVAPRYDFINDLQSLGLHRLWKRTLVKMADVQPGDRALDVCCGTGDVAFALRQSGAEVTALDFSPAMLAVAQQRARNGLPPCSGGLRPQQIPPPPMAPPPVQFLRGDALRLPFPGESFEVVTAAYGLRNLADWERGLEEMWRVARPGARLLVLDFGKPANPLWRRLYFAYLKYLVPWFGAILCKDAATHAYIFASLQNYPAQRGVAAKMESLHCAGIQVRNLMGGAMSINLGRK